MISGRTSVGVISGTNPAARALVEREVHQRELEPCADAAQEVEAAAGDLDAAGDVDGAKHLAELDVVARLEVEPGLLADLAQRDEVLLAAGGHAVDDRVGDVHGDFRELALGIRRALGERLHRRGELLRLGEQLRLLIAAGGGDLLAERLLLGAQSLGCDDGGPAPHVGVEGGVDELDGVAARCLRRPDSFRILAEQLGVNHRSSLFGHIPRNTRA